MARIADVDLLVPRQINSGDTRHNPSLLSVSSLPLPLFVPGVRAEHSDDPATPDHFAFRTDRFDRRFHFHGRSAPSTDGCSYLNRYVMRPRDRSYGESSTVTLSPGRILMKCIRILPEMCARTTCLFSSSTRNIAFGSGSMTVPSTWMPSSFANTTSDLGCIHAGQDVGTLLPHRHGVLEVGAQPPVLRHHRPTIRLRHHLRHARVHHRLDRHHLPGHEPRAPFRRPLAPDL